MRAFTKEFLSGAANGRMIKVVATTTPGTLIHTAAATGATDEVWLWAVNSDATARKLTIEWAGQDTSEIIEYTVPAEDGLKVVIPGLILSGAYTIKAFAATANVILIGGYVNRIA